MGFGKMGTKAFAYYRTSSASGLGDDKDSQTRQEVAVQSYAKAHDIEIVRAFYDEAVKGTDPVDERPDFAKMLEAIASNGVNTIIVETANRFARDLIVQETGWRFLKSQGIDLIAADSPTSFLDDTPTATLVRQILGAVSQFEKASLVAKLKAARKRTGRTGGRSSLKVSRPETVARAEALASEGLTLRAIASSLEAEGFVTANRTTYGPEQISRMITKGRRK